ncbi:MAG: cytochrome c [Planctomycetes bacterium]|nr:cytochrome c [Planctomycetota bacterium]
MLWSGRRYFVGAAVLLAGILGLNYSSTDAADPVPENEFKTLVEQDIANIQKMVESGSKGTKAEISKATRAVKSNSLTVAAFAQSRITGKNPAEDAKMATLRDAAIAVGKLGGAKKFKDAAAPAKALSASMAAGKGDTKAVDLLKALEVDIDDLMYQFKKTTVGGLGIEEEIKANAKKPTLSPALSAAMSARIQVVAALTNDLEPTGGFSAAKPKKDWVAYNKDMQTAATELAAAANGKDAKKLAAAFTKLDGSCVQCHNKFK